MIQTAHNPSNFTFTDDSLDEHYFLKIIIKIEQDFVMTDFVHLLTYEYMLLLIMITEYRFGLIEVIQSICVEMNVENKYRYDARENVAGITVRLQIVYIEYIFSFLCA